MHRIDNAGFSPSTPLNPNPLDLLLLDIPIPPIVQFRRRGRRMARNVLRCLQFSSVFEVGRDSGSTECVTADLVGIKPGVFRSPFDHLQNIVGLETTSR
jgi:hypothetical protein